MALGNDVVLHARSYSRAEDARAAVPGAADVLVGDLARLWPTTLSNAVDSGWIMTQMGGAGATGELADGTDTQVWLATGDDPAASVSGRYLGRRTDQRAHEATYNVAVQDALVATCAEMTGTRLTT